MRIRSWGFFAPDRFSLLFSILLVLYSVTGANARPPSEWKFAYMSDNKWGQESSEVYCTNVDAVSQLAQDMTEQDVSLVLAGGDMIDGRGQDVAGLEAQYSTWLGAMAAVYNAGIPVYAIPGNHEYWCDTNASCLQAWNETMVPHLPGDRFDNPQFPGMEYSFIFKNAFFMGLNQNQFEQGSAPFYYRGNDIDWIGQQLAAHDPKEQPHVVAFGHMPQFMTKWEWSAQYKPNREAFWDLLGNAGARMYFTGHTHSYAVGLATTENGEAVIYEIIAGSGGAEEEKSPWDGVYYESSRVEPIDWDKNEYHIGYALVTINGDRVKMDWRYFDTPQNKFRSHPVFSYHLEKGPK